MNGKNLAAMVGLAILSAASGCATCGHDTCKAVLDAGPHCEVPTCDRRQVHVFLINGLTPDGPSGLDGLRMKLAGHGYEKVYRGELCHVGWMWREMQRVHACDPEARFVLVGYGFGCGAAAGLAKDAARAGFPVDAIVFLDPAGTKGTCSDAARSLVIRSGVASIEDADSNGICVPFAGHFTLPSQVKTVDAIAVVLSETASRVVHPPVVEEPAFEFEDAPMKREIANPPTGTPEAWIFLYDRMGPHTLPLSPGPAYIVR